MFYGVRETIDNGISLIYTKLFWRKARIVRLPFWARNANNIRYEKGFTCGRYCRVTAGSDSNGIVAFGENFVMGDMCQIEGGGGVIIGKEVLLASKVFIGTTSHGDYSLDYNADSPDVPPNRRKVTKNCVKIGDNTWIGNNVSILAGVTIGYGCIIGAGSVVTKDVPDCTIAAGNPATIIKFFSRDDKLWKEFC